MKVLLAVLALGALAGWIGHQMITISHHVGVAEVSRIEGLFRAAGLE